MTNLASYRVWAREHGTILNTELRVLFEILPDLAGTAFQPICQAGVAKAVRVSQSRVSRSLGRLVDEGYIVPGPRNGTGNTYRLNLTHYAIERIVEQQAVG
jgi:DNA-binding MarR family transcriptional regulator